MMVEYLPPESHAVSNLLAVIADPQGAQARLDSLNKATAEFNAKVVAAAKSEEAALKAKVDAEKIKAEADATVENINSNLTAAKQDIQTKAEALDKAVTEHSILKDKELKVIEDTKKAHDALKVELSNREKAVSAREQAVTKREQEAEAIHKQASDKLAQLKAII